MALGGRASEAIFFNSVTSGKFFLSTIYTCLRLAFLTKTNFYKKNFFLNLLSGLYYNELWFLDR